MVELALFFKSVSQTLKLLFMSEHNVMFFSTLVEIHLSPKSKVLISSGIVADQNFANCRTFGWLVRINSSAMMNIPSHKSNGMYQ